MNLNIGGTAIEAERYYTGIIDATVDRGLREIEEDPKRSIRKLADMGKQFSKGRFVQDLYTLFQELLRNDDSPYYTAIEHLLRHTERKALKDFGINIGYGSLTYGARQIRNHEKSRDYQIPWLLILRMNPSSPGSIDIEELDHIIRQGISLGIYTYAVRWPGPASGSSGLADVFRKYPKCAFILFLPDAALSPEQMALLKPCTNVMTLFAADGTYTDRSIRGMQRQNPCTASTLTTTTPTETVGSAVTAAQKFVSYESSFVLMVPKDGCSSHYQSRLTPTYVPPAFSRSILLSC